MNTVLGKVLGEIQIQKKMIDIILNEYPKDFATQRGVHG
jgi:hypothetical protein